MKKVKYIVAATLTCMMMVNCGGGEKKKEKESFSYENKSSKEEVKEASNEANIVLVGDDLMKFDKTEIKAKAGQKVKLTLRHKGKLDVNVMGHNVVILAKGVDLAAFAGKAASARETNYIPAGSESEIIAHTGVIGGGQTTSIEFVAPEAGTYDFICSFPGHYAMMKGKFVVE
ncbi:plastocyanin/azurin family copper-binding protein [Seonamhaeicola marinus]|uniref:Azurin n=1 Tax=Seonamhaeicola marinus TaxID=1912246 RepID=A0A5D0HTY3_9FLAO|nr:plastocyanin/azurin family copper-binding protein [Seonamhaeicola marinus]TYA74768.1 azurin [Seonamhaeicola marinus]